jgi:hypothetical protein
MSELFYSGYLYFHAVVAHDASLLMRARQLPGMARMLANLVLSSFLFITRLHTCAVVSTSSILLF